MVRERTKERSGSRERKSTGVEGEGWQGCGWERREVTVQSLIERLLHASHTFLTGQVFRAALSNMVALAPCGIN